MFRKKTERLPGFTNVTGKYIKKKGHERIEKTGPTSPPPSTPDNDLQIQEGPSAGGLWSVKSEDGHVGDSSMMISSWPDDTLPPPAPWGPCNTTLSSHTRHVSPTYLSAPPDVVPVQDFLQRGMASLPPVATTGPSTTSLQRSSRNVSLTSQRTPVPNRTLAASQDDLSSVGASISKITPLRHAQCSRSTACTHNYYSMGRPSAPLAWCNTVRQLSTEELDRMLDDLQSSPSKGQQQSLTIRKRTQSLDPLNMQSRLPSSFVDFERYLDAKFFEENGMSPVVGDSLRAASCGPGSARLKHSAGPSNQTGSGHSQDDKQRRSTLPSHAWKVNFKTNHRDTTDKHQIPTTALIFPEHFVRSSYDMMAKQIIPAQMMSPSSNSDEDAFTQSNLAYLTNSGRHVLCPDYYCPIGATCQVMEEVSMRNSSDEDMEVVAEGNLLSQQGHDYLLSPLNSWSGWCDELSSPTFSSASPLPYLSQLPELLWPDEDAFYIEIRSYLKKDFNEYKTLDDNDSLQKEVMIKPLPSSRHMQYAHSYVNDGPITYSPSENNFPFGWRRLFSPRTGIIYHHILLDHCQRHHPNLWFSTVNSKKSNDSNNQNLFQELLTLKNLVSPVVIDESVKRFFNSIPSNESPLFHIHLKCKSIKDLNPMLKQINSLAFESMQSILIAYETYRSALARLMFHKQSTARKTPPICS